MRPLTELPRESRCGRTVIILTVILSGQERGATMNEHRFVQPTWLGPSMLVVTCLLLATPPTTARADRIAVLEFKGDAALDEAGLAYLADEVRESALKLLGDRGWEVITRENMLVLLESNAGTLDECMGECEVETGRLIGADLVVAGEQVKLGSQYRVRIKAFDTTSGLLLSSEKAEAETLDGLVAQVSAACVDLLAPVALRTNVVTRDEGDRNLGGGGDDWSLAVATEYVVDFQTSPGGAAVYVGGEYLCDTPCSRELAEGLHSVTLKLPRYEPVEQALNLTVETTVSHDLSPSFGWLTVRTFPPGLPLTVDGEELGPAPIERLETMPGDLEIWVRDPRYHDEGKMVTVVRGVEKEVLIEPAARLGGIRVRAADPDGNAVRADVLVDGYQKGRVPWTGELIIGDHQVEVVAGGKEVSKTVTVTEGTLTEVILTIRTASSTRRTTVRDADATRAARNINSAGVSLETKRRRTAGAVMGIAGGSAAVAGLVLNRTMYSTYESDTSDQAQYELGRNAGIGGMVMSISGTAFAVAGFILLVAPDSDQSVSFMPGPVTVVSGRF